MIMISQFNIVVIIAVTITLGLVMIGNYYHPVLIYGQIINSVNNSNISKLDNNLSKQIKVGYRDISYKIFNKGDPILLIIGYAGSMNDWILFFERIICKSYSHSFW